VARNRACSARLRTGPIPLSFLHELGAQDQALDALIAAVDLLRVARQADRFDERAALERLAGALDGEILDQRNLIAVRQHIADRIAHDHNIVIRRRSRGTRGDPLAARLVVDIVFVGTLVFGSDVSPLCSPARAVQDGPR